MYHSRWNGSHYDAGLHYGTILRKNGIDLLDNIPTSTQRSAFANECVPIYQKIYPEVLEEINGMADGLQVNYRTLSDFLFSMYCFVMDVHCSVFAYSFEGKTIFGRNSDFLTRVEKICDSAYYKLDGVNAFIGNTTAWTEIEDGVNEHRLAVGLTLIYPTKIEPGLNAGMIVRYILEKCKTTIEAVEALRQLPHASQHTITLADRNGDIAVVECNCERITIIEPKIGKHFVFTTNHFVTQEMQQYQYDGEDDICSHKRHQTLENALQKKEYSLDFAKSLLSGKEGFLCQYDRKTGMDTIWSTVYDLTVGSIQRTEGNPSRKKFKEDHRMTFRQ